MPIRISKLKTPDPFIMNEDTVNIAIASFLKSRGFDCEVPLTGRQKGVDVKASKGDVQIFVESKGSQKNGANDDIVFDHAQIVNHLARQIHTLMRYATINEGVNDIYILANPDIQRIRNESYKVSKMVNKMQFVRMWVQQDRNVLVEYPEILEDKLKKLNLLNTRKTI